MKARSKFILFIIMMFLAFASIIGIIIIDTYESNMMGIVGMFIAGAIAFPIFEKDTID